MKKIVNNIIEKRFIVSIAFFIISSIFGFVFYSKNLSFLAWLKGTEQYFTPLMNLRFAALFLVGYELFYIITNEEERLSFWGSIIILFSSTVAYNINRVDSLILGLLILVLFNKLLIDKSHKKNVLYAVLIVLISCCYSYTFIPYAVSFGYLFIGLLIYIILKNKSKIKNDKFKRYTLCITILLSIASIIISKLILPNTYVENSLEFSNGFNLMFSYLYSVLLPFKNITNKQIWSSIVGMAPIPLFISLYYIYKNEKHIEFLLPVTVLGVIEVIFALTDMPDIIKKVLLLNNVIPARIIDAVQLANLFIVFYFISNIKEKLFSTKVKMRVTIVFLLLLVLVTFPKEFAGNLLLSLYIFEETMLTFLFLNMEEESYTKVLVFFLVVMTLVSGVPVYFL